MTAYKFKIILENTKETGLSVNCDFDAFSANKSLIYDYVSELGGTMVNGNTARISSYEELEELSHRLLKLTRPLSKKR